MSFSYGASGYVETVTDPLGRTLGFTYNADRLETYTDAEGGVTRFTYVGDSEYPADPLCPQDTDGLRIKTIHYPGKAAPTNNSHGPSRRVLRQTAPDGRTLDFDYELTGACVTNNLRQSKSAKGARLAIKNNREISTPLTHVRSASLP